MQNLRIGKNMAIELAVAGAAGLKALAAAKAAAAAAKLAAANALALARNAQMASAEAKLAENNLKAYVYGSPLSTMPHVFMPSAPKLPTIGLPVMPMAGIASQPVIKASFALDDVLVSFSAMLFGSSRRQCLISNFI